jgi:hypothetical protein
VDFWANLIIARSDGNYTRLSTSGGYQIAARRSSPL